MKENELAEVVVVKYFWFQADKKRMVMVYLIQLGYNFTIII